MSATIAKPANPPALRLGIVLSGTVVAEQIVRDHRPFSIGQSARASVQLPLPGLPRNWELLTITPAGLRLRLAPGMDARIAVADAVWTRAECDALRFERRRRLRRRSHAGAGRTRRMVAKPATAWPAAPHEPNLCGNRAVRTLQDGLRGRIGSDRQDGRRVDRQRRHRVSAAPHRRARRPLQPDDRCAP